MGTDTGTIKFVVGSRKVVGIRRRLKTVSLDLHQLIAGVLPDFSEDDPSSDGYRVLSVPEAVRAEALHRFPHYVSGGMQRYRRHYIDMAGTFSDYLARFSSKTRSTFNRKRRKLAKLTGGTLDVEEFRTPGEIARFFTEAIPLSRVTYQARLLDSGLPESGTARIAAEELAANNNLRAFLLRIKGRPAAYLYLPVRNGTLEYAFLGHDPEFAKYSTGTILQLSALERLFGEGRYRYFDFTEGGGEHKILFGTDSVEACSFFLLRASATNRLLLGSLDVFDHVVASTKRLVTGTPALAAARKVLRL